MSYPRDKSSRSASARETHLNLSLSLLVGALPALAGALRRIWQKSVASTSRAAGIKDSLIRGSTSARQIRMVGPVQVPAAICPVIIASAVRSCCLAGPAHVRDEPRL